MVSKRIKKCYKNFSIYVVGAQKNNEGEFIFYIDPNDQMNINDKKKLYKISYADFKSRIRNNYGVQILGLVDNKLIYKDVYQKGPFGYQVKKEFLSYSNFFAKLQKDYTAALTPEAAITCQPS